MAYKYIWNLMSEGKIAFSEDAENDLAKEEEEKTKEDKQDDNEEETKSTGTSDEDIANSIKDSDLFKSMKNDAENAPADDDTKEDNWFTDDSESPFDENQQDEKGDEWMTYDDVSEGQDDSFSFEEEQGTDILEPAELPEDEKPMQKIQTVDVITKVIAKFDVLMSKIDAHTWGELVKVKDKKRSKVMTYWNYVEDLHTALNKTLGNQNFVYLDTFNNLFDKLSGGKWDAGLKIYSNANLGKPFIAEGLFLLIYELSFDWASFLIKFLNDTPEINASDFENDSFVRKFPNLTLLTYIARLVTESEEFDDFMTNKKAFELLEDDTEYNLTLKQVKQKQDMIKSAGESLTYYANLVKNDYADILAGVLDKLGVVIFLNNNCKLSFNQRINVITELIQAVSSKKPITTLNTAERIGEKTPENDMLSIIHIISNIADELVLARNEARIKLDSDKNNFILKIENQ